jgi:hypothetical protein
MSSEFLLYRYKGLDRSHRISWSIEIGRMVAYVHEGVKI